MKNLVLLFVLFFTLKATSQSVKKADDLFAASNFEEALEEYKSLLKQDSSNLSVKYNLAVCYLNTNIDKSLAIGLLEDVVSEDKANPNAWYLLGRAYHFGYRFDKAIEAFLVFVEMNKGNEENRINANKQIEYCQNAKELMKYPVNVTFENLGPNINSKYADYFPFVPGNESFILYNSTRDKNAGEQENGSYNAQMYLAKVVNGKFAKAEKLTVQIASGGGKQEVVGLNSTGTLVTYYFEDFKDKGDLYLSEFEDDKFSEPQKLSKNINTKSREIAACITETGRKIYFASDRPGGYGGFDLYSCQMLPNGEWSVARNLGPTINTADDEDFPNISADGNTLYFSSKGHTSMGGYDIFKATWNSQKKNFTGVQNIGFPINTPEDNMNFRATANDKYGYVSAVRKGGFGDLDLYRVTFEDVEPDYTVITGSISTTDGGQLDDVYIQVNDLETDEVFGDYAPNLRTSRYVVILPPGRYGIYIGAFGYSELYEEVEVLGKSSFKALVHKDFELIAE